MIKRLKGPVHVPDLIRIDEEAFSSNRSSKKFHDYLQNSRYITYGFFLSDKMFGFLVVDSSPIGPKNPNEKRIETFAVSPAMQHKGIGRKLLKKVLTDFPYHHFSLIVRPNNANAINLYKSMGFEHFDNKYMVLKRSGLESELTEEGLDVIAILRDTVEELRKRDEGITSKLRRSRSK